MIEKLIKIALSKHESKRSLGVALGFPEKYATQRVNKIIDNQNFTMNVFLKLLAEAQLDKYLELAITAEYHKLREK